MVAMLSGAIAGGGWHGANVGSQRIIWQRLAVPAQHPEALLHFATTSGVRRL